MTAPSLDNDIAGSILREFETESSDRYYTVPAKRLMEKLSPMSSHVESYQKRWFWELLQNSCDYNENVKVELIVTKDQVRFRHNGKPFSSGEVMNLIFPDSDKDKEEDAEVVGQFGSGFISTHILSPSVRVQGIILSKDDKEMAFGFNLDRSARGDKDALAAALRTSENQLKTELHDPELLNDEFKTEFTYFTDHAYPFVKTTDTLKRGLEFIKDTIPYVFVFQPRLTSVTIISENQSVVYSSTRSENCVVTKRTRFLDGAFSTEKEVSVRFNKVGNTIAAIKVAGNVILPYGKQQPRLFISYPMIGSEGFPFPCALHSNDFTPTTERETVEMSGNDQSNRAALESGVVAYKNLISDVCENHFTNVFNMSVISPLSLDPDIQKWFKVNIADKVKDTILEGDVIVKEDGSRVKLGNAKIPFVEDSSLFSEFYKLMEKTRFDIPCQREAAQWSESLNYSIFTNAKFELKELLKALFDGKGNWFDKIKSDANNHLWLRDLISLIINADERPLLDSYTIIPRQDNKLITMKADLYWDDSIPEELKDIHDLISNTQYRSILVHRSIDELGERLLTTKKTKSTIDILQAIDASLSASAAKKADSKFIEALHRILKWTSGMEFLELKTRLPWFATERATLVMRTLASDDIRDMAFKIVQSGKMEALAALAESTITSDQLNSVVSNKDIFEKIVSLTEGGDLGKLDELLNLSGELGFDKLISYGKELAEEQSDFEFKKAIGYTVEKLMKEILHNEFPDLEVRYRGSGPYDILLKNGKNGKEFFVEIKSVSHANVEPFKFAISQVRWSTDNADRYAICILKRPPPAIPVTETYIKDHLKAVFQLGLDAVEVVKRSREIDKFLADRGSLRLEMKDPDMKVAVDVEYVTRLSKDFNFLITKIGDFLR